MKIASILGLDYGVKKMGMALGDTYTKSCRPFDILAMQNGQPDWDNLLGIIESWQISTVIIGLPLHMDDSTSMLARRAAKFARRLAHRLGERRLSVAVFVSDERLSSFEARQIAQELGLSKNPKDPIDDISACLILQSYFDHPQSLIAIESYFQSSNP